MPPHLPRLPLLRPRLLPQRPLLLLLRTRQPGMQFLRCLTQIASVGLFFSALRYVGLAEATAIMDLNPVLITLGAALFLGEAIGPRRLAGIAVALIGALVFTLLHHTAASMNPYHWLFVVGAALMVVVLLPPQKAWGWLRARIGAAP